MLRAWLRGPRVSCRPPSGALQTLRISATRPPRLRECARVIRLGERVEVHGGAELVEGRERQCVSLTQRCERTQRTPGELLLEVGRELLRRVRVRDLLRRE